MTSSLPGARFSNEIQRLQQKYYITWYLDQNSSLSNDFQGPFLLTWINLNPACISNYTYYKCGMQVLVHSQTSTIAPLKFGNVD